MLAAVGALLGMLTAALSSRAALLAENMMLRQQLAVLRRRAPRPRLGVADRLFWLLARRLSASWRDALVLVRPQTVVRWHRAGFRFWWWRKSGAGRPTEDARVCALIVRLANENPTWGAPRIHGELLKLGIEVAQSTVSKYLPRRAARPARRCVSNGARSSRTTSERPPASTSSSSRR